MRGKFRQNGLDTGARRGAPSQANRPTLEQRNEPDRPPDPFPVAASRLESMSSRLTPIVAQLNLGPDPLQAQREKRTPGDPSAGQHATKTPNDRMLRLVNRVAGQSPPCLAAYQTGLRQHPKHPSSSFPH